MAGCGGGGGSDPTPRPDPNVTCADGTPAPNNDLTQCPTPQETCADGTLAPNNDPTQCQPTPNDGTCDDGSDPPFGNILNCPFDLFGLIRPGPAPAPDGGQQGPAIVPQNTFTLPAFSRVGVGSSLLPPEASRQPTGSWAMNAEFLPRYMLATGTLGSSRQLAFLKADLAYEKGYSGADVLVGVLDSYLYEGHPEFNGGTGSLTAFNQYDVEFCLNEDGTDADCSASHDHLFRLTDTATPSNHGTAVVSMIAARGGNEPARERGINIQGVAYEADVIFYSAPSFSTLAGQRPAASGIDVLDESIAYALRRLLAGDQTFIGGRRQRAHERPQIINLSYGPSYTRSIDGEEFPRTLTIADFPFTDGSEMIDAGDYMGRMISAIGQSGTDAEDKTLFVIAAGNESCQPNDNISAKPQCQNRNYVAEHPWPDAGLPWRVPALRGQVVAAVALREDGQITGFSNRCGVAALWCIAAPGENILAASLRRDGTYGHSVVRGTSFAAPLVAGGLALMFEAFGRQMGTGMMDNQAILTRLLLTANDEGIYLPNIYVDLDSSDAAGVPSDIDTTCTRPGEAAPDNGSGEACNVHSVYGHGAMDLDAATTPQGNTNFFAGAGLPRLAGARYDAGASLLRPSAAFGDALTRAFANREAVLFDSFDTPFFIKAEGLADDPRRLSLGARLDALGRTSEKETAYFPSLGLRSGGEMNLFFRADKKEEGFLSLAQGGALGLEARMGVHGLSVFYALGSYEGDESAPSTRTARLSYTRGEGETRWGLEAGFVEESGSLLGSWGEGLFARPSSQTWFAGLSGERRVGDWSIFGEAQWGATQAGESAALRNVEDVTSSAFRLSACRKGAFCVSLSQPLRTESGRARLVLPLGHDRKGRILEESASVALKPSGRMIELGARYDLSPARGARLSVGGAYAHDAGHVRGRREIWGGLRFSAKF